MSLSVLHVSSGLDPRTGGTASAAIAIAIAAARQGMRVTLAFPAGEDADSAAALAPALAQLAAEGVAVRQFAFWRAGGRRAVGWGISPALNRYLAGAAAEFDLVHTHSVWVASSLAAVVAARRAGRPCLVMPHEGFTHFDMGQASSKWLIRAKRRLRRWYLQRADQILLTSALERLNSDLGDWPRAAVLPLPAIDERAPGPPPSPPAGGRYRLGFLGRFHPKKNLALLIRALAACPSVELRIGGGGTPEETTRLRAVAQQQGVADRIVWQGFIAPPDRPAFFAGVDAVAVPSAFECFGLVAAEALAADRPVILSPTVGIADFLQGQPCIRIVPPRPDALAVAINRLAEGEPAPGGRAAALAQFSYQAFGIGLIELYRSLVKSV